MRNNPTSKVIPATRWSFYSLGGYLHHHMGGSRLGHLTQQRGARRAPGRWWYCCAICFLSDKSAPGYRSYHTCVRSGKDVPEHVGCGECSLGTGDGYGGHGLGRVPIEVCSPAGLGIGRDYPQALARGFRGGTRRYRQFLRGPGALAVDNPRLS